MQPLRHYVPAATPPRKLWRYAHPLPAELARAAIATCTAKGDLVLAPFPQGDVVAREAVQLGRRVIVVDFNPLTALLTRFALDPPDPQHLRRLTTRLGDTRKAGVRLRQHLSELYRTTCATCGRAVIADHFVWSRDENRPVEKIYTCPTCGPQTAPTDEADLEHLAQIDPHGVHRTHLLERLAPPEDPQRPLVARFLSLYTRRNLYALANLWLKMESVFGSPDELGPLHLLLFLCLDACSNLNATPWDPQPPRRLRPPPQFVELNVVRALETVQGHVERWTRPPELRWGRGPADMLASGPANALVVRSTLRDLVGLLPPGAVRLVLATAPLRDYVFWTLSYAWTGWLLGPDQMEPLRRLLDRRAMWTSWYLVATRGALAALVPLLHADGRVLLWQAGRKERLSDALILAAAGAGLRLESLVYQPEPVAGQDYAPEMLFILAKRQREEPIQSLSSDHLAAQVRGEARAAVRNLARSRGEELSDGLVWAATRLRLSQRELLAQVMRQVPQASEALKFVRANVTAGLDDGLQGGELVHLEQRPRRWWLGGMPAAVDPLVDQVERAVRDLLMSQLVTTEESVYARLPGLLTPAPRLVRACLESYGQEVGPGQWRMRPEEADSRAWERLKSQVIAALDRLGRHMGYQVRAVSERDVIWEEDDAVVHTFVIQPTAEVGRILSPPPSGQGYLLVQEARLPLVKFKLEWSRLLHRAMAEGRWDFIKMRHLLQLAKLKKAGRLQWPLIVGLQPDIERPEVQMRLL
jgi:hypothetical protein